MPLNLPAPRASAVSSSTTPTTPAAPPSIAGRSVASEYDNEDSGSTTSGIAAGAAGSSSIAAPSFTSKLGLPPPKTKSKVASASQPKKFVLDLPKPSNGNSGAGRTASEVDNADDEMHSNDSSEPANKKPRIGGGGGLSSLLPEPKKLAGLGGLKLPDPNGSSSTANGSTLGKPATSLLPHVLKAKQKPNSTAVSSDSPSASESAAATPISSSVVSGGAKQDEEEEEAADDAVLDFFGLGPSGGAGSDDDDESEEATNQISMDFFGLGAPSSSSSKTSKSIASSVSAKPKYTAAPIPVASTSQQHTQPVAVKKVSAAPTTAAPDLASNYYATLPVPTKSDPYPGFFQKPDGSWAPRRPDEWEIWSKAQGWGEEAEAEAEAARKKEKEYEMPADFSADAAEQSLEVRAAALRGKAGAAELEDLKKPGRFSEEEQRRIELEQSKAKAKKFSHNARARNQLTTLVANAQMNRTELEDRISQMKSNKRTGGQKYGF